MKRRHGDRLVQRGNDFYLKYTGEYAIAEAFDKQSKYYHEPKPKDTITLQDGTKARFIAWLMEIPNGCRC